jgi:quercetin dioxygenase-like cupin family protein
MKSKIKEKKEIVFTYRELVDYQTQSIVSSQLLDRDTGNVTVFAFDQGQKLSEHTAPCDALVQVVEGKGMFTVRGKEYILSAGQGLIMPADLPHAVRAEERFKMVLVMIRSGDGK